ncbi:MAG: NAD(P)H-dependent oxidoreductase [Rhodoferax sp.]|nr:NAD(P)H-dependent oxidoreductase [Rhodoferax sp.]
MASLNVLGICGSLRANSANRHALAAAAELMPATMQLTVADYSELPLYNQDVQDRGMPAAATRLAEQIRAADALLIASPEYNFSVSGVLKNAIDWMSRVPPQPFKDKPVALLSATAGPLGGARHQYELRKILGGLDALVLTKPEVFIGLCQTKFDANGVLVDPATRKVVTDQMLALEVWINRVLVRQ